VTIAAIYEPVQDGLSRVEEKLSEVIRNAPVDMKEQLSHALKDGGKRIRPTLTLLAGKFYRYNLDLLVPMAASLELLHIATLIHDDTVDNSHLRHGKMSVNRAWGDSQAVLLGDYVFAASAGMTAETGNIRVIKLVAQTLMTMCSGEIGQSLKPFNDSREYYLRMIGNKTAFLFSTSTESGAVLSEAPGEVVQSLRSYGYNLGIAFQIVDDILDFTGQKETMGKPVASDLSRGIFTLPVILLLERREGERIKRILEEDKKRGTDLLMEMVHNSSVLEECYEVVRSFCSQACTALEGVPHNSIYDSLINLANYAAQRKS